MPSATPYGMQGRQAGREGCASARLPRQGCCIPPLRLREGWGNSPNPHPCAPLPYGSLGSLGMGSHQWEGRYAVIDNKGKVVNTLYFTRLYYNPFNYLPHLKRSLIAVFRQTKLCEAISKGNGSVLNKFIIFSIFTFSQNKFK